MGRCDFSNVGYGMTEAEAKRDAQESAREENGHCDGYSGDINSATSRIKSECLRKPVPAKRCTVDKTTQKGTRKWVTKYVVVGGGFHGDDITSKNTQTEATKYAKEYAIKHSARVSIEIRKVLEGGDTRIATISPNKSTTGKWRFSGEARE